jgi:hypothetical protein
VNGKARGFVGNPATIVITNCEVWVGGVRKYP